MVAPISVATQLGRTCAHVLQDIPWDQMGDLVTVRIPLFPAVVQN